MVTPLSTARAAPHLLALCTVASMGHTLEPAQEATTSGTRTILYGLLYRLLDVLSLIVNNPQQVNRPSKLSFFTKQTFSVELPCDPGYYCINGIKYPCAPGKTSNLTDTNRQE